MVRERVQLEREISELIRKYSMIGYACKKNGEVDIDSLCISASNASRQIVEHLLPKAKTSIWTRWLPRRFPEIKGPSALDYATNLAIAIWEKHWKDDAPEWTPLPDLLGVLTQIDNLVVNLVKPTVAASEPDTHITKHR